MPAVPTFQLLLRSAVEKSSLTQTEIAESAGISTQHLTNCLSGARAPSRKAAEDLAKALKITGSTRDEFITAARIAKAMRKSETADDVRGMREKLDIAVEIISLARQFFELHKVKIPQELAKKLKAFEGE
jgi:transcriptional regulator with XRE-family HTH domain